MKRKFEVTIIWCEVRYSKEVEIEVNEEENGVIDDLWKDSRDWEAFSARLKLLFYSQGWRGLGSRVFYRP